MPCIDTDGDGYGWNGSETCIPGQESTNGNNNTANNNSSDDCVDPDGDGFGWNGFETCIPGGGQTETPSGTMTPSGRIGTGTPQFSWPAVSGATRYTIQIEDGDGSGYSYSIDAGSACNSRGCTAFPSIAYFDNHLSWTVEAQPSGARQGPVSFTTPRNADIQPILSNQSDCEGWASFAYDKYVVLNNQWNSDAMYSNGWHQNVNVKEDQNGNITPSWDYNWLAESQGGIYDVKAYPEIVYGSKLGTHVSGTKAETGLPEIVSQLPEFVVDFDFSETGSAERNVALESFFHDSCNIAGPCDVVDNRSYEMMIWVENPSRRTPGRLALTNQLIDGRYWDVYIKPNSNKHYIAFTANNEFSRGRINWNRFVEWTENWTAANADRLQIDALLPEYCMGAIEMGTEMWSGQGSFTLNNFNVSFTP